MKIKMQKIERGLNIADVVKYRKHEDKDIQGDVDYGFFPSEF
jgi:hypothetical protein